MTKIKAIRKENIQEELEKFVKNLGEMEGVYLLIDRISEIASKLSEIIKASKTTKVEIKRAVEELVYTMDFIKNKPKAGEKRTVQDKDAATQTENVQNNVEIKQTTKIQNTNKVQKGGDTKEKETTRIQQKETTKTIKEKDVGRSQDMDRGGEWEIVSKKKSYSEVLKKVKKENKNDLYCIRSNKGVSNQEIMKKMKERINVNGLGVQINTVKRTIGGNLLIEVSNKSSDEARSNFKKQMIETIKGEGSIKEINKHVNRKHANKKIKIEIWDIEESTNEAEIRKAIDQEIKGKYEVLSVRSGFRNLKKAIILVDTECKQFIQKNRIKIGWINCRKKVKEEKIICYRCNQRGHISYDCKNKETQKRCFVCNKEGHYKRDCNVRK